MAFEYDFSIGREMTSTPTSKLSRAIRADWAGVAAQVERAEEERRDALAPGPDDVERLRVLRACSESAVQWATNAIIDGLDLNDEDDRAFDAYYAVTSGLVRRMLTVFDEIFCLALNGLPSGARARLRTLQELLVVGAVIAYYGAPGGEHADLPTRYIEHRTVFARGFAEELNESGDLSDKGILDEETLHRLEQQREELRAKYGNDYQTLWGWAGCLFPKKTRISFGKLAHLIDLKLAARNSIWSVDVHASSEGWHASREEDHDTRDSGEMEVAASYLALGVQLAVPTSIEVDGEVDRTGDEWCELIQWIARPDLRVSA